MQEPPSSITAAIALILFNGAIWLLFAGLAAAGTLPSILATGPLRWLAACLALIASLALAWLALLLRRRRKLAFYLALGVLAIIAILSLADEVGFPDLLTFSVSVAGGILLLKGRGWYLGIVHPRE